MAFQGNDQKWSFFIHNFLDLGRATERTEPRGNGFHSLFPFFFQNVYILPFSFILELFSYFLALFS